MNTIDVEIYLSKACSPFRKFVNSLDLDDSISVGGCEALTRREIERQVRQWRKNKKGGTDNSGSAQTSGECPNE